MSNEAVKLEIKLVRPQAKLPFYANEGDAGMDITAAEDLWLGPEESGLVLTGLILNIPDGYEVQIRPRSGLSLKTRLRLPNSPGTIDSGYRDELKIIVYNASPLASSFTEAGELRQLDLYEKDNRAGAYQIKAGDRICQLVFASLTRAEAEAVDEFSSGKILNRGGGFGSTGISTIL